MTKAGEHWDSERGSSTDHTSDGLRRSIDRSLHLLGRIDVLQIHKATRDVVASEGVRMAIAHAKAAGIAHIGASVSDIEAGRLALQSGLYDVLQFPLNAANAIFLPLVSEIAARGTVAVINRPFAMGGLVSKGTFAQRTGEAFGFIDTHLRNGIVLPAPARPRISPTMLPLSPKSEKALRIDIHFELEGAARLRRAREPAAQIVREIVSAR